MVPAPVILPGSRVWGWGTWRPVQWGSGPTHGERTAIFGSYQSKYYWADGWRGRHGVYIRGLVSVCVCERMSLLCVPQPESVSPFIASSLQTAVPLQFALFELGRNPEVQERVRQQVRASWVQAGGDPHKALQGAPLLKGTIKEILRYIKLNTVDTMYCTYLWSTTKILLLATCTTNLCVTCYPQVTTYCILEITITIIYSFTTSFHQHTWTWLIQSLCLKMSQK